MRKASHVKLDRFIIKKIPQLGKHRLSMIIGGILPDCVPSFFYKKHNIENTLTIVEKELGKLKRCTEIDSYFCRHIGIITHYLSDYCTLPHNSIYSGNIKQHTIYEGRLRVELKSYLDKLEEHTLSIHEDIDSTIEYIRDYHRKYIESIQINSENIENDCFYIASINVAIIRHLIKDIVAGIVVDYSQASRGLA